MPGAYVTWWVKRGPRGVIGTNRGCDIADRAALDHLLAGRDVSPLPWEQWWIIDTEEGERGAESSRPRIKLVSRADMLAVAGR
jgi:ferredoxin--NADP+ reductase